jgi:DNA modification methylase
VVCLSLSFSIGLEIKKEYIDIAYGRLQKYYPLLAAEAQM